MQANALALLLRRMSLHIRDGKDSNGEIQRFYYYHLHNVSNAREYGADRPDDVLGRSPFLPEEWGLVGNRSDTPEYPNKPNVYSFKKTRSYSAPGKRRLAYCVLRRRSISKLTARARCPTPPR